MSGHRSPSRGPSRPRRCDRAPGGSASWSRSGPTADCSSHPWCATEVTGAGRGHATASRRRSSTRSLARTRWSPASACGDWRDIGALRGERAIGVDQTNESVVVGTSAVVKWIAEPAPRDPVVPDLQAHLAAVGFAGVPAPIGSLEWTDGAGRVATLAFVATWLPGRGGRLGLVRRGRPRARAACAR